MLVECGGHHSLCQHDTPQCESRGFPDQRELCICIPFHPQSALPPSPPSSSAMSCSSRWWQPPESCHPVSISSSAVRPVPVHAGIRGRVPWRLRRVGTASRLSLQLSRLSWHPRCSWPATRGASQRRATSQPPSLPSLPHTAVARRRHPPHSVPPATSSVWCRSCWSWY